METLLALFISFFQIGAISFGGGYAMVTPMQNAVLANNWLDLATFTEGVAIANMSPGPFAVNVATFVGINTAGTPGAAAATLGVIAPAVIFITLIARFFYGFQDKPIVQAVLSGIRPMVVGMIAAAVYTMGLAPFTTANPTWLGIPSNIISAAIALIMIVAIRKFKLHPILSIAISAVLGILCFQ